MHSALSAAAWVFTSKRSVWYAVRLMTCGEVSHISSSSRYAYDGRQDRPQEVPEGSSVEFEVELVSFEKQPDWERAPPDAKIQRAGKQCRHNTD